MTQEAEECRKHLLRARAEFYRRQDAGHRQALVGQRRGGGEGSDNKRTAETGLGAATLQGCLLLALGDIAGRSGSSLPLQQPEASSGLFSAGRPLAPVSCVTRDPAVGGGFSKYGQSPLTEQEHPLIFPPTGPMAPFLRPWEPSGITLSFQSTLSNPDYLSS